MIEGQFLAFQLRQRSEFGEVPELEGVCRLIEPPPRYFLTSERASLDAMEIQLDRQFETKVRKAEMMDELG